MSINIRQLEQGRSAGTPARAPQMSIAGAFLMTLVTLPAVATAQDAPDQPNVKSESSEAASTPTPSSAPSTMEDRLERLEQIAEKTAAENESLKAQVAEQSTANEDLSERLDSVEEREFERIRKEAYALKVYGFADVQWYKFFYDDKAIHNGVLNNNSSFTAAHWHLYLEKKLNDHFRFLGETRFLFQPYGEEQTTVNYETLESSFSRTNTKATDWVDAYYFDWGGISIQQLWIEYKLNDAFGVRVGNYLTPYGIWNVDHASTVVIPAHRPFLITAQLMPESQTGLYFFGRFFPSDKTSIDYAFTLSNGRGPTSKIYDLDENKAMGLNLSFSYDGPVGLSFGTYLYIGEFTDIVRGINYTFNPDGTLGTDYTTDTVANYLEKSMSFFLKFTVAGFLLQGEYVRGLIRYNDDNRQLVIPESAMFPDLYAADYVQQAGYALMAYRLPFEKVSIRPYVTYEYQRPSDLTYLPVGHNVGGGFNWQVTPSVSWKIEYFQHIEARDVPRMDATEDELHYGVMSTQLAVAY